MKLAFQKSTCHCLQPILREVHNQEQTQEVRLSDGMPDIGRVVGAWGQVILRSKEWGTHGVAFSGGILVWVLYVPEDGTDPRCVENWIPFQMEWDIPAGTREGSIRILPVLRFVDARSTSARKMMIRAGVGAQAEAWSPMEAEIPMAEDLEPDIQVLKKEYPLRLVKETGEKTFQLDEELSMEEYGTGAEKLLVYTAHPEVTEKRISGKRLIFKGNANLHILYRGADGQVYCQDFDLPFSQLANLEGEFEEDPQPDLQLSVTGLEVDLSETGSLRVKCSLVAQYLVSCRQMVQVIADAYSPARDVQMISENLNLPTILENREENIFGEQLIPQSAERIVDVTFLPDFPRQHRLGDQVEFILPGQYQVLYCGEDGSLQSASSRWEGSFRMPADENSRITALALPGAKTQAQRNQGQIQMKSEITLGLETHSQQGIPLAEGLELGPQKEPDINRPSLILRRTGDSGLWSIAKKTGTTVDAIREANGLTGEPGENQILLIPVS